VLEYLSTYKNIKEELVLKFKSVLIMAFLLIMAVTVSAQYTGQLGPAGTIEKGTSQGIGNVGLYDGAIGFQGAYRYGIGGYSDAGAKFGFIDFNEQHNHETGAVLGGDIKYQVMEVRIKDPIDLSVGGLFEGVVGTPANYFALGGFVTGSHPIRLNSGKILSPYGRMVFRIDWVKSASNFDLGFNAGASLNLNNNTALSAEFQFDDPFGFLFGLNFGL
jgi:hypothetical protein